MTGTRCRSVAGPGQHDSQTRDARREVPRRWKRASQRNPHLIRKPSPATVRVEHFDGVSHERRRIVALKLLRERVDVRSFLFRRPCRAGTRLGGGLAHRVSALHQLGFKSSANPGWPQASNRLPIGRYAGNSPGKSDVIALPRGPQIRRRSRQSERRRLRRPNRRARGKNQRRSHNQRKPRPEVSHAEKTD